MKLIIVLFFFSLSFNAFAQKEILFGYSKEYAKHLNAAKSHKVELIKTNKEFNKYRINGSLVKVQKRGYGWRIGDLTHSHSYLVYKARNVLRDIAKDFVNLTGQNFFVVTSLTRTLHDQTRLRKVNLNASLNESSHNFGSSFDISYVRFNNKIRSDYRLEKALEKILKSYVKASKIYYVKESKIKCFHIVVRNY